MKKRLVVYMLLLLIMTPLAADESISLLDAVKLMTKDTLDVVRGGLIDLDFRRVEIDKVHAHIGKSNRKAMRITLKMDGEGYRRVKPISTVNDRIWNLQGRNHMQLTVVIQCFTSAEGLSNTTGLLVLDGMKIKGFPDEFRYLYIAEEFSLRADARGKVRGSSFHADIVTPIRGSGDSIAEITTHEIELR